MVRRLLCSVIAELLLTVGLNALVSLMVKEYAWSHSGISGYLARSILRAEIVPLEQLNVLENN